MYTVVRLSIQNLVRWLPAVNLSRVLDEASSHGKPTVTTSIVPTLRPIEGTRTHRNENPGLNLSDLTPPYGYAGADANEH